MNKQEMVDEIIIRTAEFREEKARIQQEKITKSIAEMIKLKDLGYSNIQIAKAMGFKESEIRFILKNAINSVYGINKNVEGDDKNGKK